MLSYKEHTAVKKLRNQGRQMKLARNFRNITQKELCSQIKGLSQSNLSKFEKGLADIKEETKIAVMEYLKWPIGFLDKKINNVEFMHQNYE